MSEASPRKRAIPLNKKGVKDDWQAMRSHLETVNKSAQDQEKIFSNTLRQEYNKELATHVEKQTEASRTAKFVEKQTDAKLVQEKVVDHQRDLNNQRDRQVQMKNALSSSYDRSLDYKTQKRHQEFQRDRSQEHARLNQVRESMDEEQGMRRQIRSYQIDEEKAVLKEKQIRKMKERVQTEREKVVDAKNAAEMERKHREQQKNYYRFYQQKDQEQKKLMNGYTKTVMAEMREKDERLKNWKDGQDRQHEETIRSQLINDQVRKEESLQNANATLRRQVDLKMKLKQDEKRGYLSTIDERRNKEQKDGSFNEMMKKDKFERQKMYKQILDQQKTVSSQLKNDEARMTHSERKVNRKEMQSFKFGGSETSNSMIPGFGYSNHLKTLRMSGSQPNLRHGVSNGFDSPAVSGSGFNKTNASFSPVNPKKTEEKKKRKVEELSHLSCSLNKSVFPNPNTDKYDSSYNPITNPIPNYNQNPYLSRQAQSMHGLPKGGFFARQATNNILS